MEWGPGPARPDRRRRLVAPARRRTELERLAPAHCRRRHPEPVRLGWRRPLPARRRRRRLRDPPAARRLGDDLDREPIGGYGHERSSGYRGSVQRDAVAVLAVAGTVQIAIAVAPRAGLAHR